MITAKSDAKGLGNGINALSKEKKIKPVLILLDTGEVIPCNSAWAATDWLKENGFYSGTIGIDKPNYSTEYLTH